MPGTLNGVGTSYYGNRDKKPDGSYVTTMWMVFAFLPVVPLGSFRVWPTSKADNTNLIIGSSIQTNYYQVLQVPLSLRQVFNVYVAVYGGLIVFFEIISLLRTIGT